MNSSESSAPPPASAKFPTFAKLLSVAPWFRNSLLSVLGLGLLYALSFGPAVRLAQTRKIPTEAVEMVYTPLNTIAYLIPGAQPLLMWYVGLWMLEDPQANQSPASSQP